MKPTAPPPLSRLPSPLAEELPVVQAHLRTLDGALDWAEAQAIAQPWVQAVRDEPAPFWAMESLLREYPISSAEGLALMRLAEALLRVPDAQTAIALTADQLGRADFEAATEGDGPHPMLASLSASAIGLSKRFLPQGEQPPGLFKRLGAHTVVAATVRAIQLLGRQFVLGQSIAEALGEARGRRKAEPALRYSFDMLGEGARTERDALRYLAAYRDAIAAIGAAANRGAGPEANDGISIKLSALFPRYEEHQRERVFAELLPRLLTLIDAAAAADLNLTVDAEESERLELSLDLIDACAAHIAARHSSWRGFGLAIQAYQTRAVACVHEVARIARLHNRPHGLRLMVRLVKGAYWDGEIKRAQELGLADYPVFTHKHHTDIAYLACAQALLDHAEVIYPQFATHNAGTIAAIAAMAERQPAKFELQRLHGMGEAVYREVMKSRPLPLRIYAPVGEHRDLLAYLVRRLLENGANSSFVHQLADPRIDVAQLLASPLHAAGKPGQPAPRAMFGAERRNSAGVDLSVPAERAPLLAAIEARRATGVPAVREASAIDATMQRLHAGHLAWNARPVAERAAVLERAADRLEAALATYCGLLVAEAHKTLGDGVAEVREAVDFCRYYAQQAREQLAPRELPGPTGERNTLHLHGRGVFVCISPWNFPLAIFAGQVVAALVAGNAVAAKPAEQTPAVAQAFVELLFDAGVPRSALALLHGPGETVGAQLVAHPLAAGVCFTGSTQVAKLIQRALAAKDGPIVPLIAETGGLNAMLVDSSALPEQVSDAVVQSAFRSAGQRCSALRLLCVHQGIADGVVEMVAGALHELRLGDPAELATDVGPVIDAEAHAALSRHVERLEREARRLARRELPDGIERLANGRFIAPCAYEIGRVADLKQEVFGPVLHVVRWGPGTAAPELDALVAQINALGYGLTLGIQTRIDSRAERIAQLARVGNVYVNRNMIGAVVGVQPFGGEGLSGTGPKAGGPLYLPRFCGERTLTVNTAAAGGNAQLLAGDEAVAVGAGMH
ncbi:MAG TPA: L-glutamate gamma-semialdehyde dehydrogenase [Methylibium sp.]|uniref:L-glutamate gamma-semialdehyde dehydrogenase n=1 Tax=Methylibium sp. TaxID=2067992 RepID=UPI002DB8BDDD|nr:L-glutamate gamma-semialdehyde dehydrogenase [Methylibium sp.]HEU4458477.1 L-glutamate gamma-semialdehyde dehydrogenase [Methylibium sp.]